MKEINVVGQNLILHHWKVLFWKEKKMLVVSDVHIGKSSHFRKNGLPVPHQVGRNNFWKLAGLIQDLAPTSVLFLGDLSHSSHNQEWLDFVEMRMNFPAVAFQLVPGNHDILSSEDYQKAEIKILPEIHEVGSIIFSHDELPDEEIPAGKLGISGHVHPGVRLKGAARQSLRLPCFYFGARKAIMPAFGDFTGKHMIKPKKNSSVYVIADDEVIPVKPNR